MTEVLSQFPFSDFLMSKSAKETPAEVQCLSVFKDTDDWHVGVTEALDPIAFCSVNCYPAGVIARYAPPHASLGTNVINLWSSQHLLRQLFLTMFICNFLYAGSGGSCAGSCSNRLSTQSAGPQQVSPWQIQCPPDYAESRR